MLHWWTKRLLHTTFATLSYGYIRGSYVHYNTVYTSVSIMLRLPRTLVLQLLTLPVESSSGSTQSMSVYIIDDTEPETSKEFTLILFISDVACDIEHSPAQSIFLSQKAIQTRAQLSFQPGHTWL